MKSRQTWIKCFGPKIQQLQIEQTWNIPRIESELFCFNFTTHDDVILVYRSVYRAHLDLFESVGGAYVSIFISGSGAMQQNTKNWVVL